MGYAPSRVGLDYILCIIRLIRPSFDAHWHLVVEDEPCPIITGLGPYLRIVSILYIFTLLNVVNIHHHNISKMI